MPETLNLVVYACVLFYKRVGVGNICLRLVVVVVGDKVFNGVIREKLLELRAKLRGKGLVVRQHQRWLLNAFDHLCHCKGFSAAGNAEQRLLLKAQLNSSGKRVYSLGLVAGGSIFADNVKIWHMLLLGG